MGDSLLLPINKIKLTRRQQMKKAMANITTWLNDLTDLLKALIVFGILSGIIWNDVFGVIAGIGQLMNNIGDGGLAGLVALVLVVTWWKKK
tara:strand:+ start:1298 stop:1570 length:273 start_codon:yes stop_codon:yes gene_type:complete